MMPPEITPLHPRTEGLLGGRTALLAAGEAVPGSLTAVELAGLGARVVSVQGGRTALEYIEAGLPCDLAVVDLKLQDGIGGLAVMRALWTLRPGTPVLVITAFGGLPRDAAEEFAAGLLAALGTPWNAAAFRAAIGQLVAARGG